MIEVYKKIFEMSIDTVIITDDQANILYVNDAFTENTGYTPQEVIGKNPRIMKGDNADELTDYKEMWDTLVRGEEWSGEMYNKDKFGDYFWEFARIAPVRDSGGTLYYVGVKQNITKLKALEDKLSCLYDKAEIVSRKTKQVKEQIKDIDISIEKDPHSK